MTITLKPLHLVLIAFIAGLALAGGAALALSGRGDDSPSLAAAPSATVEAGPDVAPTRAPAPTATPPPAPTATPPPPLVVEAPQPIIRTCPEIRATGDYLNPEERAFFLANCLTQTATTDGAGPSAAPAPSAPAPSAPAQTGPTEEERAYRAKAQAQMADQAARLSQYWGTPSLGVQNDILTLGSISGNLALQMGNFNPVPPRFLQAHNQLRGALANFNLWLMNVIEVDTEAEALAFLTGYDVRARALAAAWNDYGLVVGLDLPKLP